MQLVEDTASDSLCATLRNLVQKVHGHAGTHDPTEREIADAIGPLLYRRVANEPARVMINEALQTLGWFLSISRNLGIITHSNATNLCKRIAENVSTIGAPNPSRKGLLKAFREVNAKDAREYATVRRKLRDICLRIIEYIDNLEAHA